MYKSVYLKRGKEDSLKRFHPWIFSGAINSMDENIEDGDIVRVFTNDNAFIATGFFQIGSIAVRVLSFSDIEINDEFWYRRLSAAYSMRKALGIINEDYNTTFRLFHGEGDYIPGLIVDCYGDTAVMQAHNVGIHVFRHDICKAIVAVTGGRIKNVYYKSETTLPYKAEIDSSNGFIYGSMNTDVTIENGLKFHVDWLKGGGAKTVHSVDSSSKAIELTNQNVALNFPDDKRHTAFCEDAFKYLDHNCQEQYDLVILDPPAFAKHRNAIHNALKGYTRLNQKGLQHIKSGGILFTFSCSQIITKDNFRNAVFTAAVQANRKVRILHQLHQPSDHPINIYHPEGEYLKGLVLYVE